MERPGRRFLTAIAGALLTAGLLTGPAQASPTRTGDQPFCGQVWGSLPEAQPMSTAPEVLTDVRAGRHVCFDRLVIDLRGPADRAPTYDVRYVSEVSEQGSGADVPLRGGATLRILVGAPAYDDRGRPTYAPDHAEVVDVSSFETFRQVAWAGSFEGQTSIGLGVRAHLPFRVFTLLGEPGDDRAVRLVIDVGHIW
ncbi:AMIN-like domain-containing (lipo)protein [Candidatus Blastococcus massiliensis]|uniref:AMIN-like domain-containing (lipo)protein n=1 Tax=Candidatus Blastococcus massiliensis TaxID=1470358 RepID=UPI0004BB431A|nr:hypothetical protein [Candidatus Blastococcus massiliensis]